MIVFRESFGPASKTFYMQVEYVWKLDFNRGKLLFVLNRYVPFGLVPISIHGKRDINVITRKSWHQYNLAYFFETTVRVSHSSTLVAFVPG